MSDTEAHAARTLWRIRLAHTIIWTVVAGAVVAEPFVALAGRLDAAIGLSLLVWAEIAVLVANRMRCPLNTLARRYTDDRTGNFDIFLPAWLAQHTMQIFGGLFVLGEMILIWRWATR